MSTTQPLTQQRLRVAGEAPNADISAGVSTPSTQKPNRYIEFQKILRDLNLSHVKKDTFEYKFVMELLDKRCPKKIRNTEWDQACHNWNVAYVKKGTPEYDNVLKEYNKIQQDRKSRLEIMNVNPSDVGIGENWLNRE